MAGGSSGNSAAACIGFTMMGAPARASSRAAARKRASAPGRARAIFTAAATVSSSRKAKWGPIWLRR
eukprot:1512096-Alexandrium_andersonii.AAC.1